MGWRRKIVVSTLLSFLINIVVFELAEQFENTAQLMEDKNEHEQGHEHSTSVVLKHATMWFWPELLIDTLENLCQDKLPVSL